MEKTTKKRKTKKGLKKRIGLIAIGGLSLVLTICLSVGATLAWFAGSTHADKSLYMGGPVYVEMNGRDNTPAGKTAWQGGSGNLDITSFQRGMGTVGTEDGILLPGQRFALYSQARVFSTSRTSSVGTNDTVNTSSGANVSNTSAGGVKHKTANGRITSTTTSVLRARFSVNVEFDPSVGFNNFTDTDYASHYPVQSGDYEGAYIDGSGSVVSPDGATGKRTALKWSDALGKELYSATFDNDGNATYQPNARRDGVINKSDDDGANKGSYAEFTAETTDKNVLTEIKNGTKRSIYSWKFVSKEVYNASYTAKADQVATAAGDGLATTFKYVQMKAPFDGNTKVGDSQSVYYGVWILTNNADASKKVLKESDSFYKERCNNYIQSYVEMYPTEYGDFTERTIGDGLKALDSALNQAFVNLVNDSSNSIIAGHLYGMTVDENTNLMTYKTKVEGQAAPDTQKCSWLYIDPTIGNDTNTNELSTSTGGWWYLVECDNGVVGNYDISGAEATDGNKINKTTDSYNDGTKDTAGNTVRTNAIVDEKKGEITRTANKATDTERLYAKLYEIEPNTQLSKITDNGDEAVYKVASFQFPFVNGSAVLAGDELTNIFANAKITVQISFQAVQAFFPFTTSIDGFTYKDTLLGTAKALNIMNAIPIFNEAFDYYENTSNSAISGL